MPNSVNKDGSLPEQLAKTKNRKGSDDKNNLSPEPFFILSSRYILRDFVKHFVGTKAFF